MVSWTDFIGSSVFAHIYIEKDIYIGKEVIWDREKAVIFMEEEMKNIC